MQLFFSVSSYICEWLVLKADFQWELTAKKKKRERQREIIDPTKDGFRFSGAWVLQNLENSLCLSLFLLMLAAAGLSFSIQTLSCGIWGLVSWPGIELRPPTLGLSSLNHWPPGKSLESPGKSLESSFKQRQCRIMNSKLSMKVKII